MFNNTSSPAVRPVGALAGITLRPLMRSVYMWMTVALAVSGVISFGLAQAFVTNFDLYFQIANSWIILFIIQIGITLALSFALNRMSPTVAAGLFMVYAVTMGVTLSAIIFGTIAVPEVDRFGNIVAVPDWSIAVKAFASTAVVFGVMTFVGYTTKVDLSRFSTFFLMGLLGVIIAGVINIFLRSDGLSLIISIATVLLFVGITAWDTQKIKQMAESGMIEEGTPDFGRMAILGAFMLYLDAINLFIQLLYLFSRGRE